MRARRYISVTMMKALKCLGCGENFNSSVAIRRHIAGCRKFVKWERQQALKREQWYLNDREVIDWWEKEMKTWHSGGNHDEQKV